MLPDWTVSFSAGPVVPTPTGPSTIMPFVGAATVWEVAPVAGLPFTFRVELPSVGTLPTLTLPSVLIIRVGLPSMLIASSLLLLPAFRTVQLWERAVFLSSMPVYGLTPLVFSTVMTIPAGEEALP